MVKFKYSEVLSWLRGKISSGEYKGGDKLPTEGELMEQFGVSRDTVRKALSILEGEHIVDRIKGSGTFVSGTAKPMSSQGSRVPTKRIGVIMTTIDGYVFAPIVKGIQSFLSQYGYQMVLYFTNNQVSKEGKVLEEVLEEDFDGLIIEPTRAALPSPNYHLYKKLADRVPTITIHSRILGLPIPYLIVDDVCAGFSMTEYLIKKGHHNILLAVNFDEQSGTSRYLGYIKALQKYDIPIVDDNILFFASENINRIFSDPLDKKVLAGLKSCTAVICQDDRVAYNLYSYMLLNGDGFSNIRQICGFDDVEIASAFSPTTTVHPKERFGECAAKLIVDSINNPGKDVSYKFDARLVVRE